MKIPDSYRVLNSENNQILPGRISHKLWEYSTNNPVGIVPAVLGRDGAWTPTWAANPQAVRVCTVFLMMGNIES